MEKALQKLQVEFKQALAQVKNRKELGLLKVKYLGRKDGELVKILRGIKNLPQKSRPKIGNLANQIKKEMENLIAQNQFSTSASNQSSTQLDITLPGEKQNYGNLHPITLVTQELCEIFSSMGFEIAEGPEIETEEYNFDALNIPPHHPAREMWDTFWLKNGKLLRTHTSPVQIRYMQKHKPPLRIIVPGRAYRYEAEDAKHASVFYQIEGLAVAENISFANLKQVLTQALKMIIGKSTQLRFRPSYFPFTEPSAEVDVSCIFCNGFGCRSCGQSSWIELLGAGMVHPQVLKNCNIDPEKYTGFAFGFGIERIAMLKYGIQDIRQFLKSDLRFLKQF